MKKQLLLRLIPLLLCLLLLCALSLPAFADLGDFSGDSDWGDSDWGDSDWGGSDWGGSDWGGSSYDWGGSSYSYDYGSSSSRSGSSGSNGGKVFVFLFLLFLVFMISKACSMTSSGGNHSSSSYSGSSCRAPKSSDLPILKNISLYHNHDPNFSSERLKQKLSNLYIQMQQCWQEKNIESLRPYFTDAYFSQLDRQLSAYRRDGITNYVERPVVLSVTLNGFRQEGGEDQIYATLKTRIVDYKLDDASGALLSGSRTAEKFMTYRYCLTRPTGQTTKRGSGVRSVNCPNCGAPVSVNESAKCLYCGSLVTADAKDFVIARIEGLSQRTVK